MGAGQNGVGSRLTENRLPPGTLALARNRHTSWSMAKKRHWLRIAIRSVYQASDRQADRGCKRIAQAQKRRLLVTSILKFRRTSDGNGPCTWLGIESFNRSP